MFPSDRPVRIGINGLSLDGQISSGIPRHIHEVCLGLDRQLPHAQFFLYLQNKDGIVLPSQRWQFREETSSFWKKVKPNIWLKARSRKLIEGDNLDAFWSGTGLLPVLPLSLPACLTVHDLNVKICPQSMPHFTRLAFTLFFASDLRRANAVLSVSQGTADRLKQHYDVTVKAIAPNGVGQDFCAAAREGADAVLQSYRIAKPFCLAVGTIEPRKNILNLLKAFDILDHENALNGHTLALVGKTGWKSAAVQESILRFEARWLRRLGYVPNLDLAKLYASASLLVMPSLYEGFGIPIIEARACGARVAVTDIPELREHCGNDAVLIRDTSARAIADALAPVFSAQAERRPFWGQAGLPSWEMAAQATEKALCDILAGK